MKSLIWQRSAITWLFFALGWGGGNFLARIVSIRELLGLSHGDFGSILFAGSAGAMSAFLLSGFLQAPRVARFATLGSTLLYFMTLPLAGHAQTSAQLAITLYAMGATSGLMNVLMNNVALDFERRLGRPVLGNLHASCSLGGLTGASIGTYLVSSPLSTGLHLTLVAAILTAVTFLFARLIIELSGLCAMRTDNDTTTPLRFGARVAALWTLGLMVSAAAICEGGMADWTGVYLRDRLHCTVSRANWGYLAFSSSMVATRFVADAMTRHLGPRWVVMQGGFLVMVGIVVELATTDMLPTLIGVSMVGVGAACTVPIVYREAGARLPSSPASALAAMANCSYIGFLIGPPLIGHLADFTSLHLALGLLALLGTVIIAGGTTLKGKPKLSAAGSA